MQSKSIPKQDTNMNLKSKRYKNEKRRIHNEELHISICSLLINIVKISTIYIV